MDMRRIAEELIGVAETLVGSERVGRRFMKFRKGRKYRVLKDGASLHWHVSDGPWSWKFKSVRLPAGAEIEYVGNVMGLEATTSRLRGSGGRTTRVVSSRISGAALRKNGLRKSVAMLL